MTLPTFLATGVPAFSGVKGTLFCGVDGTDPLSSLMALADKLDSPMTSKKPTRATYSTVRRAVAKGIIEVKHRNKKRFHISLFRMKLTATTRGSWSLEGMASIEAIGKIDRGGRAVLVAIFC
jgi:hypothetical protein